MVRVRRAALMAVLCAGAAHGALAQVAGPGPTASSSVPAAPAAPTSATQLTEIVVTAQRRAENLQNVPIAVTAISADRLQSANIQSTASIAAVTPALTFSDVNGFLEPRIRGVGSSSAGASVENSVATYVDGVYIASAPGSLLDLNSVERVEVLKGPQGTLFGRNATGGLVQVITKDPRSTFSGAADASYGNYDTSHVDAYVTGPLTQDLAADLALSLGHQGDGYGTNFTTGKPTDRTDKSIAARNKWLAHFGESTTVHLSFDFSQVFTSDPTIAGVSGLPNTNNRNASGQPITLFHDPHDTYANVDASHKLLTGGVTLRIDQKIGDLTLSSITAGRRTSFGQSFDADAGPVPAIAEYFQQNDQQVSQEFQLASPTHGRFTWVIGAYYFNLDSDFAPFALLVGPPGPARSSTVFTNLLDNESIAGYGQGTLALGFDTNLTAGVRYTDEERSQQATITATAAAAAGGAAHVTALPFESFRTDTPTWRVSLDHKFAPDVLGYVSWNRGFKSGGYNSSSPTAPAYLPETLDAYEIGAKSLLLDHRLRVNAAVYLYEYKNIQVNTYLGSIGVIYNGAAAENYGLDLDFDYLIAPGLTLTGGLDVMHDRFTNFPAAVIAHTAATGLIVTAPGSATGNRLPYAPDATVNLGVDYKRDLFGGKVDFFANDLYNSGFYTQSDNFLQQKEYHQLDASVTWRPADERYFVKLWANNLTNVDIVEYFAVANGGASVSYQAPRTFGGTIGLKF